MAVFMIVIIMMLKLYRYDLIFWLKSSNIKKIMSSAFNLPVNNPTCMMPIDKRLLLMDNICYYLIEVKMKINKIHTTMQGLYEIKKISQLRSLCN